ncbi:MAG TPA: His/Gly/Thr/Pro-type tRNA ligase C-terminal domain-containing protein [Planctomycetota bacterium]|nr:His/Gly/Thr/Pro-type tRNA ligase C-terminal domain-containing protein [Planctomycetota bacterium]
MSDELGTAQGRAQARARALAAFERAGFAACVVPGLDPEDAVPRALVDLIPRSAPLPQRLVVAEGAFVVALVRHDGSARALESELVSIARDALQAAGASALALTVRSLEPARALLASHAIDEEASARLLEDPRSLATDSVPEALPDAAAASSPGDMERVLLAFLGRLRFKTYGTRSPEEVAQRLAARLSRTLPDVARRIQAARTKLLELASLDGSPRGSLEAARGILGAHDAALETLRASVEELERLGIAPARVELAGPPGPLDPCWTLEALGKGALARGGSVSAPGARTAIARLDLGALGAASETHAPDLLVVPVTPAELAAAQSFAHEARESGLRAELDPSGRNLRSALRAASRRGVPFCAIVGEREARSGQVQLKDLRTEEQRTLSRNEAPAAIKVAMSQPPTPALPPLRGGREAGA